MSGTVLKLENHPTPVMETPPQLLIVFKDFKRFLKRFFKDFFKEMYLSCPLYALIFKAQKL